MNITRKNRVDRVQEYDFALAEKTGWEIKYSEFEYPTPQDMPEGAVKASLLLQERYPNNFPSETCPGEIGYFHDFIFLRLDGSVCRKTDSMGLSPALEGFKELPDEQREDIMGALSAEALNLLTRGIEGYVTPE